MREQIARTAGFNRVSWADRNEKEKRGATRRMQRAREERETEIIVEITYELCAEETGGNEIE